MYKQVLDPVGDSLGLSAIFAVAAARHAVRPARRPQAEGALGRADRRCAVAILVAIIVYSMPVGQTLDAGARGRGVRPVPDHVDRLERDLDLQHDVETGHFAVLRRSFGAISDDQRVQAVIIAFCFGALLEALAGFGTPVAITAVMLIALGFQPIKAAVGRARGQHRAGRLRRDRDPDRHARRDHRPPQGGPRRDGRPPDAVPGAVRAADPRRHGRRRARHPPGLAGRASSAASRSRSASSRARTTSRSS